MEATATSGPACVYNTASDSRGIVEPFVLQTARTFAPCSRACRSAISVSMVSPDCEMAITSVRASRIGSRYRNSLASSTSHGIRVQCSMAYLAMSPAWKAVPQATTTTLSTSRSAPGAIRTSSSVSEPLASTRPSSVSATAFGCSAISLSMK